MRYDAADFMSAFFVPVLFVLIKSIFIKILRRVVE